MHPKLHETHLKRLAVEAGLLEPAASAMLAPVRPVAEVLSALRDSGLSDDDVAWLVACDLQLPFVSVERIDPETSARDLISLEYQLRYKVAPLRIEKVGGSDLLYTAMLPERAAAMAVFLTNLLKVTVVPVATSEGSLRRYFDVRLGRTRAPKRLLSAAEVDLDTPVSLAARGLYRKGDSH